MRCVRSSRSKFMPKRSDLSDSQPGSVGLLGRRVIGGRLPARFVLNGVDVRLYGPPPGVVELLQKMLANARRADRRLRTVSLLTEAAPSIGESDAARGVQLVQESAPELLELKQQLRVASSWAAASATLIRCSTSGLRPSLLQAQMAPSLRLLVAQPFNPVYLLPLFELCAGERTASGTVARAAEICRTMGMQRLVMRKEVVVGIVNRLQAAMLCEGLWLVHGDLDTVQEMDDAVRYSFGLRRAVIGPLRIGGGGPGIRQFMEKWGPGPKSPWTKLTETRELVDAFLDKLAEPLDARSENLIIPELEQKRDHCLMAVLVELRSQYYGADETLARQEQKLRDQVPRLTNSPRPLRIIPSDRIDYDGRPG